MPVDLGCDFCPQIVIPAFRRGLFYSGMNTGNEPPQLGSNQLFEAILPERYYGLGRNILKAAGKIRHNLTPFTGQDCSRNPPGMPATQLAAGKL